MSLTTVRLAVTGHRPNTIADPEAQLWVRRSIRRVLLRGLDKYGAGFRASCGMALGTDMWFAEECQMLSIPFGAYVPFEGQSDRWSSTNQRKYRELLQQAEYVRVTAEGGYNHGGDNWKYLRRNEVMLNEADVLLSVWNGTIRGGTAHAVRHWRKHHSKHIIADPVQLELSWWRCAA